MSLSLSQTVAVLCKMQGHIPLTITRITNEMVKCMDKIIAFIPSGFNLLKLFLF